MDNSAIYTVTNAGPVPSNGPITLFIAAPVYSSNPGYVGTGMLASLPAGWTPISNDSSGITLEYARSLSPNGSAAIEIVWSNNVGSATRATLGAQIHNGSGGEVNYTNNKAEIVVPMRSL